MWRARIRVGTDHQDRFYDGEKGDGDALGGIPGAQFAIDCYRGKTKPKWWSDDDAWVHIGKLKAAIRAAIPSLLYSNPKFRVFPAARDFADSPEVAIARARAKELWLNHVWTEANGTLHSRIGILNAFFTLGAVKGGYLCHHQDDEDRGVFQYDEGGEYVLGADGDPVLERGKFLTDENGEKIRDEYGFPVPHPGRLTKEKWFLEVMDPKMLIFDVESGPDFFQHRFLIEKWNLPLEQVKRDPRFPKAARDRLTATSSVRGGGDYRSPFVGEQEAGDESAIERDEARVCGYNIYDFEKNEYLVIAESGSNCDNEFLLEGPMPPGMEHGPMRFLKYTEDVGAEWYPVPDAIDMAIINQEYDITRSQMVIHREHTKTRYLELPGAFEGSEGTNPEEERAKWKDGGDATLIKVSNAQAIMPAPKANLDGSFFQAVPNIAADFNEVGGMPGEARGVADAESATQASILASGAEIRNSDRRDNQVQKWLCELGRMLLISGQANAMLDTVVMEKIGEATGGVLPFTTRKLTPEELLGEFEVTVEIGSTLQKGDPRNIAQLREFVTAFAQNPWIASVVPLMEYILDTMNLPPHIAAALSEAAAQAAAAQNAPAGGAEPAGQQLQQMLGATPNAAAGAATGASANGYQ